MNVMISGANPDVEIQDIDGYVRVSTLTGSITADNVTASAGIRRAFRAVRPWDATSESKHSETNRIPSLYSAPVNSERFCSSAMLRIAVRIAAPRANDRRTSPTGWDAPDSILLDRVIS